jgi:hypothetical protein
MSPIKLNFFFDRSLIAEDQMSVLQSALREVAPSWAAGLHAYERGKPRVEIDVARPGALFDAMKTEALRRGPTHARLVRVYGPGPYERPSGSAELRGVGRSIVIVLKLDEWAYAPVSGAWHFGNCVSLQVVSPKVERTDAATWSRQAFELLCARLSPVWAKAHSSDEYESKNISREEGGAIGIDVSRYLPGIYWLNFFGKPYCDLIGRENLLSSPADECKEIGGGALIRLAKDPSEWDSYAYRLTESRVLNHLGTRYFFDRHSSNEGTVAPAFRRPALVR